MDLANWVTQRGGIAHRAEATAHGFSPGRVRSEIRGRNVLRIRGSWIAVDGAPDDLMNAAEMGGRITCVSLARRRGWWIPPGSPNTQHLHVGPNSHRRSDSAVLHWSAPLVPRDPRSLQASIEDALAHVARCFPIEEALAVWESALKIERIDVESIRRVPWSGSAAKECARLVTGKSDSGMETTFVVRLGRWGVPIRQQVLLAGHRVDVVIGSHLVVQLDGFEFHSSSADRTRDIRHDAELRLRGYTVLRFSYAQIMHHWEEVERVITAALARGLHLSAHS